MCHCGALNFVMYMYMYICMQCSRQDCRKAEGLINIPKRLSLMLWCMLTC